MMLMVAFAALTCAGLLPVMRTAGDSRRVAILTEFLIEPAIWIVFILVFVRLVPLKFWLIRLVLFLPALAGYYVLVRLGFSFFLLPNLGNRTYGSLLVVILVAVVDVGVLARLVHRVRFLLPSRCPSCGSFTLISDTGSDRPVLRGLKSTRWCWSCRRRYGRSAGRPWELAN